MKRKTQIKEYWIGFIWVIGSFFIAIIFLIVFLIGKDTRSTDTGDMLNSMRNETTLFDYFYDWVIEISGWATQHHTINVILISFFTSLPLLFIPFLKLLVSKNRYYNRIIFISYTSAILATIALAALWEYLEKLIIWIAHVLFLRFSDSVLLEFFTGFIGLGEPILNTILSDLSQSIFASVGILFLISQDIIKPISFLLWEKHIIIIILRLIWAGIGGLLSILQIYRKIFIIKGKKYHFPLGFYMYCFVELGFIGVLYLEDVYHLMTRRTKNSITRKVYIQKEGKTIIKEMKQTPVDTFTLKDLNYFYLIIVIYLIIQWIGTFNLHAWGFLVSNALFLIYILVLLVITKRIEFFR